MQNINNQNDLHDNIDDFDVKSYKFKLERISSWTQNFKKDNCYNEIKDFNKILKCFEKLENRSKEHENGSFIILVVGPAKSGKSTLVNLISDAYVSPTSFLECTVRPSIIYKQAETCESPEEEIFIYTTREEKEANKREQIDFIIDCIRGIETKNSDSLGLYGICESKKDLNKENIEKYVKLEINDSLDAKTLVTAIGINRLKKDEQKGLLQDNVFLVDMPGFDGAKANLDDEIYKTIAERADLVIFVQSSNAAMSKVSKQFLQILRDKNIGVPVCLLHNIFEAAYWRDKETKDKEIQDHMAAAKQFIIERGFGLDDGLCFDVNLGKVTDSREEQYQKRDYKYYDLLVDEANKYNDIETRLYERMHKNRDYMRYKVCYKRTKLQLEQLGDLVEKELITREGLLRKLNEVQSKINELQNDIKQVRLEKSMKIDDTVVADAKQKMWNSTNLFLNIHSFSRMFPSTAKENLKKCMENCEEVVTKYVKKLPIIGIYEKDLYNQYKINMGKIRNLINEVVLAEGVVSSDEINKCFGDMEEISVGEIPAVDLRSSDTELINAIFYVTPEEMTSYINIRTTNLAGVYNVNSEDDMNTYLARAITDVFNWINDSLHNIANQYNESINDIMKLTKEKIISNIIPDTVSFEEKNQSLKRLKESLINVNKSINTKLV